MGVAGDVRRAWRRAEGAAALPRSQHQAAAAGLAAGLVVAQVAAERDVAG